MSMCTVLLPCVQYKAPRQENLTQSVLEMIIYFLFLRGKIFAITKNIFPDHIHHCRNVELNCKKNCSVNNEKKSVATIILQKINLCDINNNFLY